MTVEKVSFEWSHHRISLTDSKVRTTLHVSIIDSGSQRVKELVRGGPTLLTQFGGSYFVSRTLVISNVYYSTVSSFYCIIAREHAKYASILHCKIRAIR